MTIASGAVVEIHQLLGRYCHILDARAWDRLGEVFADNAVLDADTVGLGVHEGIAAIAAVWRTTEHPIAHHVSAIVVEERESGVADILSKGVFAWPDRITGGDYIDVAVEAGLGWRLLRRRYIRRWSLGLPNAGAAL
ncbi:nuclear transport factor 2 family protein [Amorphus sp. 3PC139-8]|uniref:nuclear transport factor 2 family protein n=1 Tax=Amorphus sp. 3PC139-8 TaxID=2735676 RepID=UPI00345C95D8